MLTPLCVCVFRQGQVYEVSSGEGGEGEKGAGGAHR